MKLSFTTLSCPNWTWEKIIDEAEGLGYDGIEVRGVEGEMFLPKAKPFLPENIAQTMEVLKQKNLVICCLDTSCKFHDPTAFEPSILEGKATIDLAQQLGVPYIRVFGDAIPDEKKRVETISQVAEGLEKLGVYAEEKNVMVLIETHGDFSSTADLLAVLEQTNSPAIGVLWDIHHPYKACEEPMTATYDKLGKYIKHTHLKDSKGKGGNAPLCLVGEGDLPIVESLKILKKNGFDGWLSLEWEKKWHPEIEEPEIALPSYIVYMKRLLENLD